MLTFLCTIEELELTVPSSSCIMTSSGMPSSMTSCMLFTLLLRLPVLTDTLGMEWMLPRLSTSRFRLLPCSLSSSSSCDSFRGPFRVSWKRIFFIFLYCRLSSSRTASFVLCMRSMRTLGGRSLRMKSC